MLMAHGAWATTAGRSSAEILRDLRKLSVVGSALYVAAHPDDENTRLLASLANETLVRTAYLSLTRGEGGQNLIGAELGPSLGMLRTQELLAARRIDGAEQFFTRARDFGYSKSVDETLSIWGKDQVLADAVWVIRTLKPDVIITRFAPEAGDTHGHHTASARIALEAFAAAADPRFHAEQLAFTSVWQAKRIVWNTGSRAVSDSAKTFMSNSGAYDPLLGLSYGELAAQSRSMHKSQGFGAASTHGPTPEQFVVLAGSPGTSLFDGVDLSWRRAPGAEQFAGLIEKALREYQVDLPAASVPTLLLALDALRALPENPWRAPKLRELTSIIVDCAGLFVEATATDFTTVPGAALEVTTTALNRSSVPLWLKSISLVGAAPVQVGAHLAPGVPNTQKQSIIVPLHAEHSNPLWLEKPPSVGLWALGDWRQASAPQAAAALQAEFELTSGPHTFTVTRALTHRWVDPIVGERWRSVEIVPPLVVKPDATVLMFDGPNAKTLHVTVTAMADVESAIVEVLGPQSNLGTSAPLTLEKGAEAELSFSIQPDAVKENAAVLRVVAKIKDEVFDRSLLRVDYPHISIQTALPRAEVRLVKMKLVKGATRLGYFAGAGDDVPEALRQVGYDVTMLNEQALRSSGLGRFDAIVIGIRAYNVNPAMPTLYPSLMRYVKNGGTLVVQYNTKNWLSRMPAQIGPYPFEVSQARVTDEAAQVVFELPKHHVLTAPNVLGPADFEGWVQERGLYFASTWHSRYQTPLSMHDPGEPAQYGGLLVARHGKGTFVYTGLSFFRQLPAGVPGAFRLFANLLAHGS